jgi:hypothetical protein
MALNILKKYFSETVIIPCSQGIVIDTLTTSFFLISAGFNDVQEAPRAVFKRSFH